MGEDDIVELLWKRGQVVRSSQTQTPPSNPPHILRGCGSGGGEGNASLPLQPSQQDLFIQEDEMAYWLHHPPGQDYFRSDLLYSGPTTQPPSSVSLAPPPDTPYRQIFAGRRAENFMNFLRLRENILTGGRVEAGPLIPVVRETLQVGSSATQSSSATESCGIATTAISRVSSTFAVPDLGWKDKPVAIAGTPSSEVSKAETEPIQIQPATETEPADDRKRKEREETIVEIQETEEARGSTSRKRSRAAEIHNLSERRRREKINEKMTTLQELIPCCTKTDKASMLDDAIEYVKWLQSQLQMMSTGCCMMPMMYPPNMQPFMPMGMMGMNRPPFIPFLGAHFPRQAHMAGVGPSYPAPRYPIPVHPSRVHLPSSQPNPVSNQTQFPAYMNPYSQFPGRPQMQQPPPPLQNQTTSKLSFSQESSSKEPEDQGNQPKESGI